MLPPSPVNGCCYTRKEDQQRRQKQRLVWNIQQQSLTLSSISLKASTVNYSKTPYVLYHISFASELVRNVKWVSSKRYSEFYRFRKELLRSFCKCQSCRDAKKSIRAIDFPSRIHLRRRRALLIQERIEKLEAFVLATCQYLMLPKMYDFTRVCRVFLKVQRRLKEFFSFPLEQERLHIQAIKSLVYTKDGFEGDLETGCPICLGEFVNFRESTTTQAQKMQWLVQTGHCQHLFHPDCIHEWFKTRFDCPICRKPSTDLKPRSISYEAPFSTSNSCKI